MELVFITEARFLKDAEGKVFSTDGTFSKEIWARYLSSFSHIYVIARINSAGKNNLNENFRADLPRVSFIELPYYKGFAGGLMNYIEIKKVIKGRITKGRGYICRCPGILGSIAAGELRKKSLPYGVEVVGDPYEVFAPGAFKSMLRPFFRTFMTLRLKRAAQYASAVLYVTGRTLQKRYPAKPGTFTVSASNVMLLEENILKAPREFRQKEEYNIISIGSLEQMYKAPDVTLKAIQMLNQNSFPCRLTWIGEGKYKQDMIQLSRELGIEDRVRFTGSVAPGESIRRYLDTSDIFLLASRTEGLPRAMIEAMARGLPCIGSNAGGIPELLEKELIVPKNDPEALFEKVKYLMENPDKAALHAERNLQQARAYVSELLDINRRSFYETIKTLVKKGNEPCQNRKSALSYQLPLPRMHS
ncbi:MAG TPA: glycosyltransferase [Ignavibacteriales bacterium]|nr:glycosyltransferase [Ignavibacteriales bacterium]